MPRTLFPRRALTQQSARLEWVAYYPLKFCVYTVCNSHRPLYCPSPPHFRHLEHPALQPRYCCIQSSAHDLGGRFPECADWVGRRLPRDVRWFSWQRRSQNWSSFIDGLQGRWTVFCRAAGVVFLAVWISELEQIHRQLRFNSSKWMKCLPYDTAWLVLLYLRFSQGSGRADFLHCESKQLKRDWLCQGKSFCYQFSFTWTVLHLERIAGWRWRNPIYSFSDDRNQTGKMWPSRVGGMLSGYLVERRLWRAHRYKCPVSDTQIICKIAVKHAHSTQLLDLCSSYVALLASCSFWAVIF